MASQGPYYSAWIEDSGGINPWSNPENVGAEDGAFASLDRGSMTGATSNQLIVRDFGFTIPETATIDGILVEIKRWATLNTGSENFQDYELFMEEDGSFTVNFAAAGNWGTSLDWISYGGIGEFLGIDDFGGDSYATPGDINYFHWGMSIKVNGAGVSAQALIDAIRITVYYTDDGLVHKHIAADCTEMVTGSAALTLDSTKHLAADCAASVEVACALSVVSTVIPACVIEFPSDTTYEIPWESCQPVVEWESCTIYEIPWTSDC